MPWREQLSPLQMARIAIVAPKERSRDVLRVIARSGAVQMDLPHTPGSGNEEMERVIDAAVVEGPVAAWVGWTPISEKAALTEELGALGAAVTPLKRPRGVQPPTKYAPTRRLQLSGSLVDTYSTVPYSNLDPAKFAGLAYVFMFGMMFADVGHGVILVIVGLLIRSGKIPLFEKIGKTWAFVTAAGATSMVFGFLYGEAFGPTGLVPTLWINPLDDPTPVMVAALVVGAVLLAIAHVLGAINRVREGGWGYALYASSGVAGAILFLAVGLLAWGLLAGIVPLTVTAIVVAAAALILIFIGFLVDAGGGGAGVAQAIVELLDSIIRLGSNIVSFVRLAAFGLTHGALLMVVWEGTTSLWGPGWRAVAAVLVFLVGNIITFALEGLVAGIQALRLEYYELFSRIFKTEGRPFVAWSPTLDDDPAGLAATPTERGLE
ncbi:MAG TPA: V-type ATPase 116kDa subunit family protein [Actinomycetaceae bacterium]|nr:V-type ATPase 116kDa subunit family protein [Actinomycetaceae bacterium]